MGMQITRDMLTGWQACDSGMQWFEANYPEGSGDYQNILNKLAADDRPSDACWLMDHAGADDSVIEVEAIADMKHFFAAGQLIIKVGAVLTGMLRAGLGIKAGEGIKAGWGIKAGLGIEAGEGIEAGLGIKAGWGIKAGEGIKAGWGIEAGLGWAVFAGLRIKTTNWSLYAKVSAKSKPGNLFGGHWVDPSSEQKEAA